MGETAAETNDFMQHQFTLEYWRDGQWYVGRLKGVPAAFSQGKTLAELEDNVRDAYHLLMEAKCCRGRSVTEEGAGPLRRPGEGARRRSGGANRRNASG